jgi:RNA polymerase sigma-70 factor (ECF subfamily)
VSPPSDPSSHRAEKADPKVFVTTRWSVVAQAGQEHSPAASAALEKLCRLYWFPVYAEVRRRGNSPHDAQDLTQEFFARLLERNTFANADQAKGRFRSYLIGALNYFLGEQRDRRQAAKRGGGVLIVSLDAEDAEGRYLEEPAAPGDADNYFDQHWRATLMEQALTALKEDYQRKKKAELFEELHRFLGSESGAGAYEEPARKLGMTSAAVAVAVHRMRHRYGEIVRALVADSVANPADVEDEIRRLFT